MNWITDYMPQEDIVVLVTVKNLYTACCFVVLGRRHGNMWFTADCDDTTEIYDGDDLKVVAWADLPEAYRC